MNTDNFKIKSFAYWIQFVPMCMFVLLWCSNTVAFGEFDALWKRGTLVIGATALAVFIFLVIVKSYRNPFASAFNLVSIFVALGYVCGISPGNDWFLIPLMAASVFIVFVYRILFYPSGVVYPDPSLSPSQVRGASCVILVVTLVSPLTGPLFFIIVPAAYYYLPVIVKEFTSKQS